MKAGRKRFTAKFAAREKLWGIEWAATVGDIALTEGAKIARKWHGAVFARQQAPGPFAEASFHRAVELVNAAMMSFDSQTFREIAGGLDAMKEWGHAPAANEAYQKAAYFIGFCRNEGPPDFRKSWTAEKLAERIKSPTLIAAWKRPPHNPTVREIHQFLCEVMAEPPDYKTAERAARLLGIAATATGRPKKKS